MTTRALALALALAFLLGVLARRAVTPEPIVILRPFPAWFAAPPPPPVKLESLRFA